MKSLYLKAGIFFLIIQLIVLIRNASENYIYFFWFCDFAPLLLAIAFFTRKDQAIKAVINFGLIPQIIFLLYLLFISNSFLMFLATFLIHSSVLIALILTSNIKSNKNTIIYSIILILSIYTITLIFTPENNFINLVYSPGNLENSSFLNFKFYTELWPFLTFVLLVLPTHGIQNLLSRK
jgi:hypothetical protein